MFDPEAPGADYELAWPRALFVQEGRQVAASRRDDEVEHLLSEAFTSDVPLTHFRDRASAGTFSDPWNPSAHEGFLERLLAAADRLPSTDEPARYWRDRQVDGRGPAVPPPTDDFSRLHLEWAHFVLKLQERGYLDARAPRPCVDDDGSTLEPDRVLSGEIETRIGIRDSWPLRPWAGGGWTQDEFFDLVEVVHDLVARPRRSWWHSYGGCGSHYSVFVPSTGRILYRTRVNALLARHGLSYALADDGEDVGRLTTAAPDARARLLKRALARAPDRDQSTVAHAVALHRSRNATREDKRSACIALAGLLEERRTLIKAKLLSGDEGMLFEIANRFNIRHRNADQHDDYADLYLDWLFWIQLATYELCGGLAARG